MANTITRRGFMAATAAAGVAAAAGSAWSAEDAVPVGVALVGGAHIHTPGFINTLRARKDLAVKAVWDHDQQRADNRAKALGGVAVVNDVARIFDDPQIKAVIICSETNRHRDLVLAAAKGGKHIFAEKPLGITGKESREMADAIDAAEVLFSTGYFMRGGAQVLFLREQVQKGNFGKITRVRGSNCHEGSLGHWFDTEWRWMADPKIAGCGGFGDLGTHSLDILMWLMGDIETVTADIKVVTGNYGDCDESGEALIRFKNGVTGTLAAGWVDRADPVPLLISGTEGHAAIMNGQVYFKSTKVSGAEGQPWKQLSKALPHAFEMFLNAVVGKEPRMLVTPQEAAARVVAMEAMYQANKERAWVKVG